MKDYTEAEIIEALRKECAGWGNLKRFARKAGCTDAFVSQILTGRKTPTGCVLNLLGFEAVKVYRKRK